MQTTSKKFRVAEIFGPTIQGEGRHAGAPCHFVRFGGCDYRCVWCDTPHAVLSEEVAKLKQLAPVEILWKLRELQGSPEWVVLSGGNPGLLDLGGVVGKLQTANYKVMLETQGSTWRDWYCDLDELCFSPKPPSSTMDNEHARVTFKRVVEKWEQWNPHTWQKAYIKVVVFDDADYEYAKETHHAFDRYDFFISAGNEDPSLPTVGNPNPIKGGWPSELVLTRSEVLEKTRWLFEKTSHDPDMAHVRVMPQLHTLAWGNERGR